MADLLEADCLAPWAAAQFAAAAFDAPANSCDTHAHVIARDPAYPLVADRSYTPPAASAAAYLAMLDATGMSRGVLVQVSVHGTDNRLMLEALADHPQRLRGVAVIDPDISDAALEAMHAQGVRGARFNLLFGGGVTLDVLETIDARLAPLGWHLQFLLDGRDLPAMRTRLTRLRCPVVIDHMGHMPVAAGVRSDAFQTLQRLIGDHGWWVKLSGAYRISDRYADDLDDVTPWARALIDTAPDRMLYGSDWPHVALSRMVDTGVLRNRLMDWAPDPAVRHRILVDNPARLYDFSD